MTAFRDAYGAQVRVAGMPSTREVVLSATSPDPSLTVQVDLLPETARRLAVELVRVADRIKPASAFPPAPQASAWRTDMPPRRGSILARDDCGMVFVAHRNDISELWRDAQDAVRWFAAWAEIPR